MCIFVLSFLLHPLFYVPVFSLSLHRWGLVSGSVSCSSNLSLYRWGSVLGDFGFSDGLCAGPYWGAQTLHLRAGLKLCLLRVYPATCVVLLGLFCCFSCISLVWLRLLGFGGVSRKRFVFARRTVALIMCARLADGDVQPCLFFAYGCIR